MYHTNVIKANELPAGTLCLTFDDGPGITIGPGSGPRTRDLATFLMERGIRATFFVTGQHAELYPELLALLQEQGHLVANHTYSHPNIVNLHAAGGSVANEIIKTDCLIRNYVHGKIIYFRPPYLAWEEDATVAHTLNSNLLACLGHVGPIDADIFIKDYNMWGDGRDPEAWANDAMNEVEKNGRRGIILMHDSTAGSANLRRINRTFELTEILVSRLQRERYRFIRLDEVPQVAHAARIPLVCGLRGSNDKYISAERGGDGTVWVNGPRFDAWEHITIEYLGAGSAALRAPNGKYLSAQGGGGAEVLANGFTISQWERFDLIPVGDSKVAFKTINGNYLTRENAEGGRLMANVDRLQGWEVFTFENHS